MSDKFFITTTIPYVNSTPHVGHAQEFVLADACARFHRQNNADVILQSGTDDNAVKNVLSAKESGIDTKTFVDRNAKAFQSLLEQLNVKTDFFVRTSSKDHEAGVTAFIRNLNPKDLYTDDYSGLYCQGCEDFFNPNDLVNGLCPDHQKAPEQINERNVFFRLSKYQDEILKLIETGQVRIEPASRKKEIIKFISAGLKDISISRSSDRSFGWGVPFPDFPDQVVYVWIDALINYLSGSGYGRNENWRKTWNQDVYKIHVIGKNVWKFHAIYWVALLLSAELPLPNEIFIHGFLTTNGTKISKSLNNGGNLLDIIKEYGSDGLRYFLLSALSLTEDADFSESQLNQIYNAELANKIGNLASRLLTLRSKISELPETKIQIQHNTKNYLEAIRLALQTVNKLNREIDSVKPWELLKANEQSALRRNLLNWISELQRIAYWATPVIPLAASKLENAITDLSVKLSPLFPKK